jgi:hypothetical protein
MFMTPAPIRAPLVPVMDWQAMRMKDIMTKKRVLRIATEERRAARINRKEMTAHMMRKRPIAWLNSSLRTPSTM